MVIKKLSALVSEADITSPIMTLILKSKVLEITEDRELAEMHSFITGVIYSKKTIEDAERFYGPGACELLTKDQAERFVYNWLDENGLVIGQSASNLLSENRRIPLTNSSLSKGQIKGNRHRYGACPYNENCPLSYLKVVLLRWLEEHVRPEAKVMELSS